MKSLRKLCTGASAVALSLLIFAGTVPLHTFASDPVQVSVTSQVPAEYRVPTGTALEEIGLPDSLQIAPKAEGGAASNTAPEEAAPNSGTAAGVTWVGDYDPNTAGTYRLTAAFLNGAYTADNMPAVTVISSAPQKTGAALPRAADPIEEATLEVDGLTFTFTLYPDTGEATLTDVSEPAAEGTAVAVPDTVPYGGASYRVTDVFWAKNPVFNSSSRRNNVGSVVLPDTMTTVNQQSFRKFPNVTAVTIPGSIAVFDGSFQSCAKLEALTFQEGVEEIASNLMVSGCTGLTQISLPSTLKLLSRPGTFSRATALTSIALPDGLKLGEGSTFSGCTSLKEVRLPASVDTIPSNTFSDCTKLTAVTAEGAITSIGSSAFYDCAALTAIPSLSAVTSIDSYAFSGCDQLAQAVDLSQVSALGSYAFYECYNLTCALDLSKLTAIPDKAFSYSGISSVKLSDQLTSIGVWAFLYTDLTEIDLPSSLASIGSYAFWKCSSLETVVLPDSVTSLGENAFQGCTALRTAYIGSGVETVPSSVFADDTSLQTVTFNASADDVTVTAGAIPDGVEVIYLVKSIGDVGETIRDGADAPTLQQAIDGAPAGEETTLLIQKDIKLDQAVTVPAGKKIRLRAEGENGYTITANQANALTDLIAVERGATLTLSGKLKLSGHYLTSAYGRGTIVDRGALVVEEGVTISDYNISSFNSGAVLVTGEGATFEMNGGLIAKNRIVDAQIAGAVLLLDRAEFVMNSGRIAANQCSGGNAFLTSSGVMVTVGCTFSLQGGEISENTGYRGSAVFAYSDSAASRATFRMTGGTISGNKTAAYGQLTSSGAVFIQDAADFSMEGGAISDNTGGNGAGVCVVDSGVQSHTAQYKTSFVMDGGVISGNRAVNGINASGGGIYSFSNFVVLNAGIISGNSAVQGGGMYSEGNTSSYSTMALNNAVITENTATSLGGGMWFCQTGEAVVNVKNGGAIYANTAGGAGDDFVIATVNGSTDQHNATLSKRLLGGGAVSWYRDGGVYVPSPTAITSVSASVPRYDPESGDSEPLAVENSSENLALKAVVTPGASALANRSAKLFIVGNKATRGGGIGANGGVVVGEYDPSYLKTITVKKVWSPASAISSDRVKIQVLASGYALDSVTLTAQNDWTGVLAHVPADLTDIAVKEEAVSGFQMSYTVERGQDGNWLIVVTNAQTPSGGETLLPASYAVAVEKLLDGAPAEDGAFQFALKDASGNTLQVKGNAGKDVLFAPLSFDRAGVYTYSVEEIGGDADAVEYDASVYTLTLTIGEGQGRYVVSSAVWSLDGRPLSETPVFKNCTKKGADGETAAPDSPDAPSAPAAPSETGDSSRAGLWLPMLALSATGLAAAGIRSKKAQRGGRRYRR